MLADTLDKDTPQARRKALERLEKSISRELKKGTFVPVWKEAALTDKALTLQVVEMKRTLFRELLAQGGRLVGTPEGIVPFGSIIFPNSFSATACFG